MQDDVDVPLPCWRRRAAKRIASLALAISFLLTVASTTLLFSVFGRLPACAAPFGGLIALCVVALLLHVGVLLIASPQLNATASEAADNAAVVQKAPSDDMRESLLASDSLAMDDADGAAPMAGTTGSTCRRIAVALLYASCTITVAAVLATGVVATYVASHALFSRTQTLTLQGLHAAATVRRDGDGVIHIAAADLHDAAFAQGVVHAQERGWQMEFQRRVGSGRLSELVGDAAVDPDILMRTLGFRAAAQRAYDALPTTSTARVALDAFAAGVNAARSSGSAPTPVELLLFNLPVPEPWSAVDSLVWAKVMSYDLSGNWKRELSRYRLATLRGLSPARVAQLIPAFDAARFPTVLTDADIAGGGDAVDLRRALRDAVEGRDAGREITVAADPLAFMVHGTAATSNTHSTTPETSEATPSLESIIDRAADVTDAAVETAATYNTISTTLTQLMSGHVRRAVATLVRRLIRPCDSSISLLSSREPTTGLVRLGGTMRSAFGSAGASNNWVVGANWTAARAAPLLCNDPHLSLLAPSIWLLTRVRAEAEGFDAIGASFVGVPGVVIGRTAKIAWGVTNTGVDVQDLYELHISAANASEYEYDGGVRPIISRVETIRIAGAADRVITVRSSHHGPVVTDNGVAGKDVYPRPLALRWTSIDPTVVDTTVVAFLALGTATDWTSFRAALAQFVAPSQNFVYAEAPTAAHPFGRIGYQMPGLVPRRNLAVNHTGAWPAPGNSSEFEWLGYVPYDALPRTVDPPEGLVVSANNQVPPPSYPIFLSADWDEGGDGYRAERIHALLRDGNGQLTPAAMARIQGDVTSGYALDIAIAAAALPDVLISTPGGRALRALLASWNGTMELGSAMATISATLAASLATLPANETGTDYWREMWYTTVALANGGSNDPACVLAGAANCSQYLARTLDTVAASHGIQSDSDGTGSATAWGRDGLHSATFTHAVLGASPLACFANVRVDHGGDDATVNVGTMDYSPAARFAQAAGPSYRQIVDLSAPDAASLFSHGPGQSGNLVERRAWYSSLAADWASVKYLRMSMAPLGADAVSQQLKPR